MKTKHQYGCEVCGKGVQFSNLVSHAKNRTKTIRRPNLHRVRVLVAGKVVKQTLCTTCLRQAKRPHKIKLDAQKETLKKK